MTAAASASRKKSSALFASSQFLAGRIALSSMVAIAARVTGLRHWPEVWFVLMIGSVLGQLATARRRTEASIENENALTWLRTFLSFFDTAMYSLASALISHAGSGYAAPFGITVIMLTMLYVMMHFYMQPKLVLFMNAPCFIGLIYCLFGGILDTSSLYDPARLYLAGAGAVFTFYFFYEARNHLAKARRALMKSRSEAFARATDAQAANQVKSDFLATMGHEIRTPLNGVLGLAQVMDADDLSPQQRDRLGIIRTSGQSLLAILNDLLDISKIEAGKLELEIIDFSVRELVQGVHATFAAAAALKSITLHLSFGASAEGGFRGDPARLRQVLYNLVSNAVKFTHQGEVCVTITYEHRRLRVEVRDTGVGIPQERQSTLFEKFVQADASTTRKYGGTGLGLAISDQLVRAMDGALSVQSTEGVGTTFCACIPLARIAGAEDGLVQDVIDRPAQTDRAEGALRVLVAEDNATNQIVIKLMLNQIGVQPYMVDNGRTAVEAFASQAWDVIMMDIQMPEMDGAAATREIREQERGAGRGRTPILALTANTMTHQSAEYLAAGMDRVISKPIDAKILFAELEAALSPAADRRAAAAA